MIKKLKDMKLKKFNEDVDTQRQEMLDYYFQSIQDKIKELLSTKEYGNVNEEDAQKFNDSIFTQHDNDARGEIHSYINDSFKSSVDPAVLAKNILDRYYTVIDNNEFSEDSLNDVENPLDESVLKFDSFIIESNEIRYYFVSNSSWFDMNKYDIDKMNKIMDNYNIPTWLENDSGQNNLPEVLCFMAHHNLIPTIEEKLNVEFKTEWIAIHEKDW